MTKITSREEYNIIKSSSINTASLRKQSRENTSLLEENSLDFQMDKE